MSPTVSRDAKYRPSDDLVVREIEGQLILVPVESGIADMEGELYALNEAARAVWEKLDGARTLATVINEVACEFAAPADEVEKDVVGLMGELVERRMVVSV